MKLMLGGVLLAVLCGIGIKFAYKKIKSLSGTDVKKCPYCGKSYRDNPYYCPHCGEVVSFKSHRR